jgi:phosphinothricin acetyltransferase
MSSVAIRLAGAADLPAIADIYNHEVAHATSTFDTEPVTLDSRRAWLEAHDPARHPVIVAERAGQVVGFASLSSWSERCAYARAAEVSVYVHRDHRGSGAGRALLAELIERGRTAGLGVLLARISAESQASLRLHESLGFQRIGTMRRVGEKFKRILDIELYDLHLDETAS